MDQWWHNPCNRLHIQVKRHSSWCIHEGKSSRHLSAHKGAKTECALTLRNAASLQKHCSVACKARVKQVRPWTFLSMVYVPLCTKLAMSDIGDIWASSIATLYHPPVENEELRLSFLVAHCIVNGESWRLHSMFALSLDKAFLLMHHSRRESIASLWCRF